MAHHLRLLSAGALTVAVVGASLTVATPAVAAPPTNDDFLAALPLAVGVPHAVDNSEASLQASEPAPTCAGINNSVWYTFTPAASGRFQIDTIETFGAVDTVVAVHEGSALDGLTEVACDDEMGGLSASKVVTPTLTGGTTYRIQVASWTPDHAGTPSSTGPITTKVTAWPPPAPDNDDFAAAEALTLGVSATADNTIATLQAGEPTPTCAVRDGSAAKNSVWYTFTPAESGTYRIDTLDSPVPVDTVVAVYEGSALDALTQVACDNDGGDWTVGTSDLTIPLAGASTYRIQVSSWTESPDLPATFTGPITTKVTTPTLLPPPPNDDFAAARSLGAGASDTVDNLGATMQPGEPHPTCVGVNNTVWYAFTPPASGPYRIDTMDSPDTPDTVLAVYEGAAVGALTEVACDDDGGGTETYASKLEMSLTAGTTYRIQVSSWAGEPGNPAERTGRITTTITPLFVIPPPPPTATPTTAPTTPPAPPVATAPSRMRAPKVVVRGRKVIVKWRAATANGSPVVRYRVDISKGKDKAAGPSVRKIVFKRLKPGRYRIRVAARNAVGTSPWSAWVKIRIR